MTACVSCGKSLGLLDELRGRTICAACSAKQTLAEHADLAEYSSAAAAVIAPEADLAALSARMRAAEQRNPRSTALAKIRTDAYRQLLGQLIDDAMLTEPEQQRLDSAQTALGVSEAEVKPVMEASLDDLFVALANAGRVPARTDVSLLLKKGEVAYLQRDAQLLKQVTLHEFRGGSAGISIPVGAGVRVRVGQFRGHSVAVGEQVQVQDQGVLTVTSTRVVFAGAKRSIEIPYGKVLDFKGYQDGVQFHLSNRVEALSFRLAHGPLVVAAVNYAIGRTS